MEPGCPSQRSSPPTFRPRRSRLRLVKLTPAGVGRTLKLQAPTGLPPCRICLIATSMAGRLRGSTFCRGSGASDGSLAGSVSLFGRSSRSSCTCNGRPEASGMFTCPLARRLTRPSCQPSPPRRRFTPRLSRDWPKPLKRSICSSTPRSRPAAPCTPPLLYCLTTASQASASSSATRPRTNSPEAPGNTAGAPPSCSCPRPASGRSAGAE
ncbi:hypothetical protein D3C81_904270 [compost metagenome]